MSYDKYYGQVVISSPATSSVDTIFVCYIPYTSHYDDTLFISHDTAEQGDGVIIEVTTVGFSWSCRGCDDGGDGCRAGGGKLGRAVKIVTPFAGPRCQSNNRSRFSTLRSAISCVVRKLSLSNGADCA